MKLSELPIELLENREMLFGYQIRLLIEDLKNPLTERISMVIEDINRDVILQIANQLGFLAEFSSLSKKDTRVMLRCERSIAGTIRQHN